jgi:hypothetical protein
MNDTVAEPAAAADRAAMRAAIEATQAECREAIAGISDEGWRAPSGSNPGWTRGQLAWHVGSSVDFFAGQIESARKGRAINPPSFLLPTIFKMSEVRVRFKSRRATRESVLADVDAGVARLCRLLDLVPDGEFAVSKTNFGETRTIAQMFGGPAEHLAEHKASLAGKA